MNNPKRKNLRDASQAILMAVLLDFHNQYIDDNNLIFSNAILSIYRRLLETYF